jgi:hypothetical protein
LLLPTVVFLLALDQRTLVDPQNVSKPCKAKQSSVHRVELFCVHKTLPCSYAIDLRRGESSLNSRGKSRTLRPAPSCVGLFASSELRCSPRSPTPSSEGGRETGGRWTSHACMGVASLIGEMKSRASSFSDHMASRRAVTAPTLPSSGRKTAQSASRGLLRRRCR